MRYLIETIGGIWELLLLLVKSGMRLRGKYWRWRIITATGNEKMTITKVLKNAIDYGRWIYRMKRLKI
mgnify:CR=1 FL=1